MTKEQFLLELEHIAESGSNEIRLGELYEKVSTENEAEKRNAVVQECIDLILNDETYSGFTRQYYIDKLEKLKTSTP